MSSQLHTAGKEPSAPTGYEARWATEAARMRWRKRIHSLSLPGIELWPSSP